jgi:hypothetical protein
LYGDLFLGDGGVWNNLGTNWEEQAAWIRRDLVDWPDLFPHEVEFHVVVDASRPAKRPHSWRTKQWPLALDQVVLSIDRSLQAAFRSTLDAGRRLLQDANGFIPKRILYVSLEEVPHDKQFRSALLHGAPRAQWQAVSQYNAGLKTVLPTMFGLPAEAALHLLAHGYAQTAAQLTARGAPFRQFELPHDRMAPAMQSTLSP